MLSTQHDLTCPSLPLPELPTKPGLAAIPVPGATHGLPLTWQGWEGPACVWPSDPFWGDGATIAAAAPQSVRLPAGCVCASVNPAAGPVSCEQHLSPNPG